MIVQQLPKIANGGRAETAAMQFGDDWPGVFIRGDNACWYAQQLSLLLKSNNEPHPITRETLWGLVKILESCKVMQKESNANTTGPAPSDLSFEFTV